MAQRYPFWEWLVAEAKKPVNIVYLSDGVGGYDPLTVWLVKKREEWEEMIKKKFAEAMKAAEERKKGAN